MTDNEPEKFKKYPKIRRVGHDETKEIFENPDDLIYITEKIDGGNFRFTVHNGVLIFGSRTQQITSDAGDDTNVSKQFTACVKHIREKLSKNTLTELEGLLFFGECCVRHTLPYDWETMPHFLGFDIFDKTKGEFLNQLDAFKLFESLSLDCVPVIDVVPVKELELFTENTLPQSRYPPAEFPDMKVEGVVYKNYSAKIFAKFISDKFKEANAKTFGGNPKYNKDSTHNNELVFKYCTNARIEKTVHKLVDEGHKLEMALMKHLPFTVYTDIVEEHSREIMFSRWTIDFKSIRKLMAKRCSSVLTMVIDQRARERLDKTKGDVKNV